MIFLQVIWITMALLPRLPPSTSSQRATLATTISWTLIYNSNNSNIARTQKPTWTVEQTSTTEAAATWTSTAVGETTVAAAAAISTISVTTQDRHFKVSPLLLTFSAFFLTKLIKTIFISRLWWQCRLCGQPRPCRPGQCRPRRQGRASKNGEEEVLDSNESI